MAETMIGYPERWAGPSVALSMSDGTRAGLILSGWRARSAAWEQRIPTGRRVEITGLGPADAFGDGQALWEQRRTTWSSFELEVLLDDTSPEALDGLLRRTAGDVVADGWRHLQTIGSLPITVNHDLPVPDQWVNAGVRAVDLLVCTLPSRRAVRGSPVVYATRWVRLVTTGQGMIAAWAPPEGRWPPELVRWPHHAIPSRAADWYTRLAIEPQATPSQRLTAYLNDLITHERYFHESWSVELELWEENLFAQMAHGEHTFAGVALGDLQAELNGLAEYISAARRAQRAWARRSAESSVLRADPQAHAIATTAAAELGRGLDDRRRLLRDAFGLLSSAASGVQVFNSEKQRHASERLNNLLTLITAILLAPTLVISVYGANIRELSPENTGTLPALLVVMLLGAVVSATVLAVVQRRPLVPAGRRTHTRLAVGAATLAVAGTAVAAAWATPLVTVGWATAMAGTSAVAAASSRWTTPPSPSGPRS